MDATPPKPSGGSSGPASGSFVITNCRQCAAGWTRTRETGAVITVCLLDREAVLHDMTACDRYEVRKAEVA